MVLLQQMTVLFFLMAVGFLIRKKEFILDADCRKLSWIVVNIANPALIISGGISDGTDGIHGKELLTVFALAAGLFAVMIVLSRIIPLLLRVKKDETGVYSVMLTFSNIGFMGFPLIQAMYGNEALLYAAVFQIPFNILIYTYGVLSMQRHEDGKNRMSVKKIFNVGTVCCVISLILSQSHMAVPEFVKAIVKNLSSLTAPLSMMVIGASLVSISVKELCGDLKLLVFSLIKLIVLPVIFLFCLKAYITDEKLLGVCLVMLATPVASMTAMLAQQYDCNYELASRGVALTTVLSVVTMPLVSLITGI